MARQLLLLCVVALPPPPPARYRGHLSIKTVKDVAFVGPRQSMVAAGSDDGRLFVWDRNTGEHMGGRGGGSVCAHACVIISVCVCVCVGAAPESGRDSPPTPVFELVADGVGGSG